MINLLEILLKSRSINLKIKIHLIENSIGLHVNQAESDKSIGKQKYQLENFQKAVGNLLKNQDTSKENLMEILLKIGW